MVRTPRNAVQDRGSYQRKIKQASNLEASARKAVDTEAS